MRALRNTSAPISGLPNGYSTIANPQARGYVLDDQSALRKHMTIFVDGHMIRDRTRLADAVSETSTIYVFQALSGG